MLVVSQFTLYADMRKGRRPSFIHAVPPDLAEPLVESFKALVAAHGVQVAGGVFGAHMDVQLNNRKPVTSWIDRDKAFFEVAREIRKMVEELHVH